MCPRPASGSASSDPGDPTLTAAGTIDGTWKVGDGSKVQYRIQETLNGQADEATGSTTAVTGQLAIGGTAVSTASFSVDMKQVSSDESQRDGQFQNRIMNTSKFPTATFELTAPIELTAIPDNLVQVTVKATGKLTLHGTTNTVTFDLLARRNGAHIEVNGTIPITFSDYGINNPSGGPASVGRQRRPGVPAGLYEVAEAPRHMNVLMARIQTHQTRNDPNPRKPNTGRPLAEPPVLARKPAAASQPR